jgi:hypothetical protein
MESVMEFCRFAYSLLVRYRQEIMVHGTEDMDLVEFYENGTFRECTLDIDKETWMARMSSDIMVFHGHIRSLNTLRGEERDAILSEDHRGFRSSRAFRLEVIEEKRDRIRESLRYAAVRLLSSPTFDYSTVDAIYKRSCRDCSDCSENDSSKRVRIV